jgi:uncharacterized oligopeptide transporter (OPT) family protein
MNIPTQASPMVQSSVPYMSEQSMTPAAMSTSGQAKGIMAFVKKNPAVAAIGAGAIALGAYMMLGPKKKTRASGLSGTRKTTRRTTRKTSSAARSRSRRSSIPKLNLK